MSVEVGQVVTGKVTKVMAFGAFVQLDDGGVGMIHISEVSVDYVKDINEHLKHGDRVRAVVVKIDEDGKISLSIKKAMATERKQKSVPVKKGPVRPADIDWGKKEDAMSFEDKLSRFKQMSDENMLALKRSNESKRSGGYKRTH